MNVQNMQQTLKNINQEAENNIKINNVNKQFQKWEVEGQQK